MTELQTTIKSLTQTIIDETILLGRLEREQKKEEIKALKTVTFPFRFFASRDDTGDFLIGLLTPGPWKDELPEDYEGRHCFRGYEIRQIIVGLQTLLGETECQQTNN